MVHQTVVSSALLVGIAAVVMISSMISANPAPTALDPQNYMCKKPSDCQPDECCVIGMQRYSTPSCAKMLKEGDTCRPQGPPVNTTFNYPNGIILEVQEVYTVLCPCDSHYGLDCYRGTCIKSTDHEITNAV